MMEKTIEKMTVDKQVLMEALTTFGSGSSTMPNPDDGDPDNPFGPYGPGGPVLRDQLSAFYSKTLTRRFIQTVVTTAQVNALQREKAGAERTRSAVIEFVDDFCGTKWPRPFPFPPNPPRPWWWRDFDPGEPRPIDLIAAGLEFYNAAKALKGTELQDTFEEASNKLIQTGLNAG